MPARTHSALAAAALAAAALAPAAGDAQNPPPGAVVNPQVLRAVEGMKTDAIRRNAQDALREADKPAKEKAATDDEARRKASEAIDKAK